MSQQGGQKVKAAHLRRYAYLYIRQSSPQQVLKNTESARRQRELQAQGVALGWPLERIVTLDGDQGKSARATAAVDRKNFEKLVTEVSLGHVGLVMGMEVSRLARNNLEWHRLLEICAVTETLILDNDGLYDPRDFNDRLLLGLKGAMSEAELHFLKSRMQGAILSKASRGELRVALPVGLAYDALGRVVLEPDQQVQETLRLFFQTFQRTASAVATVKHFRQQRVPFPHRVRRGGRKGELIWVPLTHDRALKVLHNPRYAGAFVYGRTRKRRTSAGKQRPVPLPREEWHALLPDAHPGYITWAEYEENEHRLAENAQAHGQDRRKSPPREGPALLQGIAVCGKCGRRMTVRYHNRSGKRVPDYVCEREGKQQGGPTCQRVPGGALEVAIGELLLEAVTPVALEVTLQVQQELLQRAEEADRLRRLQVERARYEAELSQRRYLQVDPGNRLVAAMLEGEWNEKLRALGAAQEEYAAQREQDTLQLGEEQQAAILALAGDFPRLWRDPQTPDRERKRMVRLLLEDVTLVKDEAITAHVRFRGGAQRTLVVPLGLNAWQQRQTEPVVVARIDRLLDEHTDATVARILNEEGLRTREGHLFDGERIRRLRNKHGLAAPFTRWRARGMMTEEEVARELGISVSTVKDRRRRGLIQGRAYNDVPEYLYDLPARDGLGQRTNQTADGAAAADTPDSTSGGAVCR